MSVGTPTMGVVEPWSRGHSEARICITCGGQADRKPVSGCTESRHQRRYDVKRERNNEYRRQRRSNARASGDVYRGGRGDMVRKAKYNQQRHRDLREVLFDRLGTHCCARCGFSDKRALQFDHLNGGGGRHRRSLPSGSAYYRSLLEMSPSEFRTTFQVLCANCNVIKRDERQEWRWRHACEDSTTQD